MMKLDADSEGSEMDKSQYRPPITAWFWVVAAITWTLVAIRAIPATWTTQLGDRGIFVSVAERLLAGDRLYVDVWDNKDPLFYYSIAAGRALSPLMDIVMEWGWLVLAAVSLAEIARRANCDRRTALVLGWIAGPLILTGVYYFPGNSNLPGTAVALGAVALAMSSRPVATGIALAALLFLKLPVLPIAATMVVVVLAHQRTWRHFAPMAGGLLTSIAALAALMWARGELGAYVEMLQTNVGYANSTLVASQFGPILTRLARVAFPEAMLIVFVAFAVLSWLIAAMRGGLPEPTKSDARLLGMLTGTSLLSAGVVLGATGLWWHHDQVLYIAACMCMVLLARLTDHTFATASTLAVVAAASLAVVLGGSNPRIYYQAIASAPSAIESITQVSPEAASLRSARKVGSYARIGTNDDRGHAFGLRSWQLACPRFHQYPYDPIGPLNDLLDCLPTADVIVISPSGRQWLEAEASPDTGFGRFIAGTQELLASAYECHAIGAHEICERAHP